MRQSIILFIKIWNFSPQSSEIFFAAKAMAADHAFDGAKWFLKGIETPRRFILGFTTVRAGYGDELNGHELSIIRNLCP
jgi:hypothetical protein